MTRANQFMRVFGCQCLLRSSVDAYQAAADPFDYAFVDDVTIRTRIVNIPIQRKECREEPVTRNEPPNCRQSDSYTATIAGGIGGAALRKQSGRSRVSAPITGFAPGPSVGRDDNANRADATARSDNTIEQCYRLVTYMHAQERPGGFLATDICNGRVYQTTMPHHPGDWNRVRVDVSPAAY